MCSVRLFFLMFQIHTCVLHVFTAEWDNWTVCTNIFHNVFLMILFYSVLVFPSFQNCTCVSILAFSILVNVLVMVALCNRADHYIFILFLLLLLLLLSFFFSSPNLSGRRLDVYHTSTHMCEFRMQVWNVLHAARWKYRTQKSRQKSPSRHHRTTLSCYIFATKARIDNRKKLVKHQYVLHMSS